MDKKTERDQAIDIALLKQRVGSLEDESRQWKSLIWSIIKKAVVWLITMLGAGWVFGWQLPESTRKALSEWILK